MFCFFEKSAGLVNFFKILEFEIIENAKISQFVVSSEVILLFTPSTQVICSTVPPICAPASLHPLLHCL